MHTFLTLSVAAIALAAAGCAAPSVQPTANPTLNDPSAERACRAATISQEGFRNCMGPELPAARSSGGSPPYYSTESATSAKQRRIEAEKANCPQIAESEITESAIQTNMRTGHFSREEALNNLRQLHLQVRQLKIEQCQRRAEMTPAERAEVDNLVESSLREAREELQTEAELKRDGWHVARYGVRPGTGCGYITYARTLWEKCP